MNRRPSAEPPWEFLLSASRVSLQSFELSRLSHAANVRKEIVQLLDTWLEETSAALLARWLIEHQAESAHGELSASAGDLKTKAASTVSDNILAEQGMPAPSVRRAM